MTETEETLFDILGELTLLKDYIYPSKARDASKCEHREMMEY